MSDVVGVIGGSGLYGMPQLQNVRTETVTTPFGDPSDALVCGTLEGVPVVFVPRHGVGHRLLPSEVPYAANIWALKKLGVTRILSVSAVGSLREDVEPGHLVAVDQFLDRTSKRRNSFFGGGVVGHVSFGDPVCSPWHAALVQAARDAGGQVHPRGTYLCMEGPAFSTRAESLLHRRDGADVVGMTNMPEAKLAREAELCFATLALATDYDCWHTGHDAVTVEAVVAVIHRNVALAQNVVRHLVRTVKQVGACACSNAAQHAVMTDVQKIPAERRKELDLLYGKYWNVG